jgi:hypothetical protein
MNTENLVRAKIEDAEGVQIADILSALCDRKDYVIDSFMEMALGWIAGHTAMISWGKHKNILCITPTVTIGAVRCWSRSETDEYYNDFIKEVLRRLKNDLLVFEVTQVVEDSCIVIEIYYNEQMSAKKR